MPRLGVCLGVQPLEGYAHYSHGSRHPVIQA